MTPPAQAAKKPVTLAEALVEFKRPFHPRAVKWKIQDQPEGPGGAAKVICHIDARHVLDRLNDTVHGDWGSSFQNQTPTTVVCNLTVLQATRADIGSNSATGELGAKGMYSDALKRAAVQFGIGASLYALPAVWVSTTDLIRVAEKQWAFRSFTEDLLADKYGEWLKRPAIAGRFGEILEHGEATEEFDGHRPPLPVEWVDWSQPPPEKGLDHDEAVARFMGILDAEARKRGASIDALADSSLDRYGVRKGQGRFAGQWRLAFASIDQLTRAADAYGPDPELIDQVAPATAGAALDGSGEQ